MENIVGEESCTCDLYSDIVWCFFDLEFLVALCMKAPLAYLMMVINKIEGLLDAQYLVVGV